MSTTPPAERKDDSREGFSLRYVVNLIDATCFLAIVTAVLYFWGYVYFAGFTEALGVPYHGVSLSLQEYVTASWIGVLYLFFIVGGASWILWILDRGLQQLGLFKKSSHEPKSDRKPPREILRFGMMILVVGIVLLIGALLMLFQGKQDARRVLNASQEVIVRTSDGKPVEGHFIYLRDFGSTLLVREMSADMKTVLGSRWLKEGSYSSYTLLDRKPDEPAPKP